MFWRGTEWKLRGIRAVVRFTKNGIRVCRSSKTDTNVMPVKLMETSSRSSRKWKAAISRRLSSFLAEHTNIIHPKRCESMRKCISSDRNRPSFGKRFRRKSSGRS